MVRDDEAPPASTLGYWSQRERWEEMGRKISRMRREAQAAGLPLEALPGARTLVAAFKSLGKELDRRIR